MSRESVLARARGFFAASLTDACTIARVTGTDTNPITGVVTETEVSVYTGPCRVQEVVPFVRETSPAPAQHLLGTPRVLQLPVATSLDVKSGDIVTITACTNDPDLVGRRMAVRGQKGKSEATSRRLDVEEMT